MPISAHYGLTVLIWGLTWTAIRLQVEAAPVDISVFYRFVMASVVTLVVPRNRIRPTISVVMCRTPCGFWRVVPGCQGRCP